MEPECSLPHSQMPATCPYPEPDQSSPFLPSHFLKNHLNPLNAELYSICHLLALLGAHPILHISRIRVNIILPSTPGYSKWSLSVRVFQQNLVCISPLLSSIRATCSAILIFLYLITRIFGDM